MELSLGTLGGRHPPVPAGAPAAVFARHLQKVGHELPLGQSAAPPPSFARRSRASAQQLGQLAGVTAVDPHAVARLAQDQRRCNYIKLKILAPSWCCNARPVGLAPKSPRPRPRRRVSSCWTSRLTARGHLSTTNPRHASLLPAALPPKASGKEVFPFIRGSHHRDRNLACAALKARVLNPRVCDLRSGHSCVSRVRVGLARVPSIRRG